LRVYINGESKEVQGNPSLADLITQLDLPAARIAVELNREVVRRSAWGETMLRDEDRIEIVHFVGGGFVPFCESDTI
jgi:thiamine biosynthesis protein ThiS